MKVGSKQQGRSEASEDAAVFVAGSHNIHLFASLRTLLQEEAEATHSPDLCLITAYLPVNQRKSVETQRGGGRGCDAKQPPGPLRTSPRSRKQNSTAPLPPGRLETCGESVLSVCSAFSSLSAARCCKHA